MENTLSKQIEYIVKQYANNNPLPELCKIIEINGDYVDVKINETNVILHNLKLLGETKKYEDALLLYVEGIKNPFVVGLRGFEYNDDGVIIDNNLFVNKNLYADKIIKNEGLNNEVLLADGNVKKTYDFNPKFETLNASSTNIIDLNNINVGGFYYCNSDANKAPYIKNTPLSNEGNPPYDNNKSFFLLVETWGVSSNYIKQTLTYYKNNYGVPNIYVRTCSADSTNKYWSNWYESVPLGSFDELQTKINNATNGVLLLDKNYISTRNQLTIPRDMTILGNGYTLDGNNLTRIINGSGHNLHLNNVNFVNGYTTSGGAVYCDRNLIISNCNFANNKTSSGDGGAVEIAGSNTYNLRIFDSTFQRNSAGDEAGAVNVYQANGTIYNCNFINNYANTGTNKNGGAIKVNNGANVIVKIHNSTFLNNEATQGSNIFASNDNTVETYNCNFINGSNNKVIANTKQITVSASNPEIILFVNEASRICQMRFYGEVNFTTANTDTTVGTIPSPYRPKVVIDCATVYENGTTGRLYAGGGISARCTSVAKKYVVLSATYPY